jgi:hypothetical protein
MNRPESTVSLVSGLRQNLRRRSFLLGAVALSTSASFVLSGCATPPATASADSLKRLLGRLVPLVLPKGTPLHAASVDHVMTSLDGILGDMDSAVLSDLEMAVTLFEYGAGLTTGRFSRFSTLSDTEATAVLDEWQNGSSLQRGIATVFKKLVYLAYWRDPETWPAVDFDGPVSVKWGLPSLGNAALPEDARHE